MKRFDVQSIELNSEYEVAFTYISDPKNLPEWTKAFHSVGEGKAVLQTPTGRSEVELKVRASREQGSIDWMMRFPDGSEARAYSRLIRLEPGRNAYSFVLTPPPVPLNQLEGTLQQQSQILKEELERLQQILERTE